MAEFICLFFPSFIALSIFEKEKKSTLKDSIYLYFTLNAIINCITITCVYLFKKKAIFLFNSSLFSIGFCSHYLSLSIFVSILLPYVYEFITKNIQIKIEKVKNEKR